MALDIISYEIGKNSGGGSSINNQNKNVTITENGTTTLTADTGYTGLGTVGITTNVPAQGISDYFNMNKLQGGTHVLSNFIKKIPLIDTSNLENMTSFFQSTYITEIPLINTSNVTSMTSMFNQCFYLTTVPLIDTSKVTDMRYMFNSCSSLTTIPQFDTSSVTNMSSMFYDCVLLSDTSLNNILAMCIGATSYTGTKTLSTLGIYTWNIPASRIEALSNYQDFINAGWTIS